MGRCSHRHCRKTHLHCPSAVSCILLLLSISHRYPDHQRRFSNADPFSIGVPRFIPNTLMQNLQLRVGLRDVEPSRPQRLPVNQPLVAVGTVVSSWLPFTKKGTTENVTTSRRSVVGTDCSTVEGSSALHQTSRFGRQRRAFPRWPVHGRTSAGEQRTARQASPTVVSRLLHDLAFALWPQKSLCGNERM